MCLMNIYCLPNLVNDYIFFLYFFFYGFIYFRERARARMSLGGEGQRAKQTPH